MPKTKLPKKTVLVATKIPIEMYEELLQHLQKDTHTSLSELIRDAIREWLERHRRR